MKAKQAVKEGIKWNQKCYFNNVMSINKFWTIIQYLPRKPSIQKTQYKKMKIKTIL